MYLKQLNIHHLRNLQEVNLHLSPRFNLFIGKNGSGKTSLLEAVYLLATGRSFRTHQVQDFIQTEQSQCCVAGQILTLNTKAEVPVSRLRVGIQRDRLGGREIRINEEVCRTRGELAKLLPIQIMNIESYQLFDLLPKYRRSFLDWGVFHVEPTFSSLWTRYQRILKQRNAAIKRAKGGGEHLINAWDGDLVEVSEKIHVLRTQFVEDFLPYFRSYLEDFLKMEPVTLSYYPGWSETVKLEQALLQNKTKDLVLGYTTLGAHRADFRFNWAGKPIETLLSRGQLKLFVAALMLARHAWLFERKGCQSVFLLDDLSSELDKEARSRLLQALQRLGGQVWATAIEDEDAFRALGGEGSMFHMEQGRVQ